MREGARGPQRERRGTHKEGLEKLAKASQGVSDVTSFSHYANRKREHPLASGDLSPITWLSASPQTMRLPTSQHGAESMVSSHGLLVSPYRCGFDQLKAKVTQA